MSTNNTDWKYAPGEAWYLAVDAVKQGRYEEAEALLPHMLPSDRDLMTKRIAAAKVQTTK